VHGRTRGPALPLHARLLAPQLRSRARRRSAGGADWILVSDRAALAARADASGEIALYQDGQLVLQRTSIATDDTTFAQWYVGNFADALTPADSTIYVDDVTIRPLP